LREITVFLCVNLIDPFVNKPPTEEEESAELISLEENLAYKAKLAEIKQKAQTLLLRPASAPPSLQNQCRLAINQRLDRTLVDGYRLRQSLLSHEHALFELLRARVSPRLVNFLSYSLIDDLYGSDANLPV
jgi:hypothetical protein